IRSGQAGIWDRFRYWWLTAKFWCQILTGRWQAHPIDIGFDIPRTIPLSAEELRRHVDNLRALFPHAEEKALRDLLPLNRFPAEELMREFLQSVNLPGFFAYLNYDYLEEHTVEELQNEDIRLVGELRFTKRAEL